MPTYVIGQIQKIKNKKKWLEYKQKVKHTLEAYNAKLLFRGSKCENFVGNNKSKEIVAIEFESNEVAKSWFESPEYQSIIPIRQEGADITLEIYE